MKRSKFLKVLGIGTVGAVIGTKIVLNGTEVAKNVTDVPKNVIIKPITKIPKDIVIGDGWISQLKNQGNIVVYSDHVGAKAFEDALNKAYALNPQTPYEKWWEEYMQNAMDQRSAYKASKFF